MTETYHELYAPIMHAETMVECVESFDRAVRYLMVNHQKSALEARALTKHNVGYYAGYYSKEVFDRVMEWLDVEHPYFGKNYPSPEEAFETGKRLGEAMRNREEES